MQKVHDKHNPTLVMFNERIDHLRNWHNTWRPKIRFRSHNNSKLLGTYLFFWQLKCIFTTKDLYRSYTHFKGLNMEIQWVFTFLNNFNLFISKVFAILVNFKNFLGLCAKNEYKDCNMNSMQDTKGSLDETTTTILVMCVM
jgi:hypothetical protein